MVNYPKRLIIASSVVSIRNDSFQLMAYLERNVAGLHIPDNRGNSFVSDPEMMRE